ncbi:hypothetical protein K2173_017983 [Erythroxylum novogranatense]|uniref:B box-type domain-containing protein n=1 Tax=Erythroxylum novogranatense TaxID=1862640 RepID=A0AAV8TUD7_9ROSI|nr:hypothetical protein K2173_017983 [Erythroxylum novogranatense]
MKAKARVCELCDREARLYCESDAAFLCSDCDFNVHDANFLVARHIRRLICSECKALTGYCFSGARSPYLQALRCRYCSSECVVDEEDEEEGEGEGELDSISCSSSCSSTLSLACISSNESQAHCRKVASLKSVTRDAEERSRNLPGRFSGGKVVKSAEGVFVNWCKKLGLNGNPLVSSATRAFCLCWVKFGRVLPLRVCLAASFWSGLRLNGDKSAATWHNTRRLEEVSGVPMKLIIAVESKIEHFIRRSRQDLKEGWAES